MEFADYLQFLLALIFVLGLIGICALLLRRFGPGMQTKRRPGSKRRLEILESLPLDTRRRFVLIRRDEKAHLVLMGQQSDCVIERDIPLDPPYTLNEPSKENLSLTSKTAHKKGTSPSQTPQTKIKSFGGYLRQLHRFTKQGKVPPPSSDSRSGDL